MIGERFGRWTVTAKWRADARRYKVRAVCDCGTVREMRADTMAAGRSQSCGCRRSETSREAHLKHDGKKAHARSYRTWKEMRQRCLNPDHPKFRDYGGRGILICPEWSDFANFLSDMGDRPANTTLGRVDNDAGYSLGNCRWETAKQQANNTRRSILIEYDGSTRTIAEWSDITGIKRGTIQKRYHAGKPASEIFATGEMQ